MIGLVGIYRLDDQWLNLLRDDSAGGSMTDMGSGAHSGDMGSAATALAPTKETGQTEGTQDSENSSGNGTTRHPLGLSRGG